MISRQQKLMKTFLGSSIVTIFLNINVIAATYNATKTIKLNVANGEVNMKNKVVDACAKDEFISVVSVSVISRSILESNTGVEPPGSTEDNGLFPHGVDLNVLLKQVKYEMNFRKAPQKAFTIDVLKKSKQSFVIGVDYMCFNATTECNPNCIEDDMTCLPKAGGTHCECLAIPVTPFHWDEKCSDAVYLGCKEDKVAENAVHVNISIYLTPKICIRLCQMIGHKIAVVNGENHGCYCQQNIAEEVHEHVVKEEKCLRPCKYDPDLSCGNFPYKHYYETGIKGSSDHVCSHLQCGNGTYCRRLFEYEFCICNQSSSEKPPQCYGCLPGWFSIVGFPDCYHMANISTLGKNQMASFCESIHGKLLQPRDMRTYMILVRLTLEGFLQNNKHQEVEKEIEKLLQGSEDILLNGLPLCERPKTNVTGKFPWAKWPRGTYGLPMSKSGCPKSFQFEWLNGTYIQDTEDTNNGNDVSNASHLMGAINNDNVTQQYCIKTKDTGDMDWPIGRYCIYKKGPCPNGMNDSSIFWDDEDDNNTNTRSGILPDGMFKADTIVDYCCMNEKLNKKGIVLPRDTPFYLFPYKSKECQHVVGTSVTLEYVQFDLENDYGWLAAQTAFGGPTAYAEITRPNKHLQLYYCFYNPIPSCGTPFVESRTIKSNTTEFDVGHVLHYTCPSGYVNNGDKTDTCLPSEMWSSLKGVHCEDINECTSGKYTHKCHKKANCYNTLGSYHCKCNPGWQGDGMNCDYIKCAIPPSIGNGVIISKSKRRAPSTYPVGVKVELQCDTDYLLIGYNVSFCESTGTWSRSGKCVEQRSCLESTYKCKEHKNQKWKIYCDCIKVIHENKTGALASSSIKRWNTTVISVTTTLIVLIVVVVFGTIVFFRLRARSKMVKKKTNRESQQSIYADINEIQVNLKLNRRKSSSLSNLTACSSLKCTSPAPFPPRPRSSIESNASSFLSARQSSRYRRRSDFGIAFPNQHSTIFGNKGLSATTSAPPQSRDQNNQSTQFKLHSITNSKRRNSSIERYTWTPFCPSYGYTNPSNLSPSYLENITEHTTPCECGNSYFTEESPYIDVVPDVNDTGDGDDEESISDDDTICTDHYRRLPKFKRLYINGERRRQRSKTTLQELTEYEEASQRHVETLRRDSYGRSRSLPEGQMKILFGDKIDFEQEKKKISHPPVQKKESNPKKRTLFPRISLKLKFKAISTNHKKGKQQRERNASFQDDIKYKVDILNLPNEQQLKRPRSETVPSYCM